jgi:hypothetical protein
MRGIAAVRCSNRRHQLHNRLWSGIRDQCCIPCRSRRRSPRQSRYRQRCHCCNWCTRRSHSLMKLPDYTCWTRNRHLDCTLAPMRSCHTRHHNRCLSRRRPAVHLSTKRTDEYRRDKRWMQHSLRRPDTSYRRHSFAQLSGKLRRHSRHQSQGMPAGHLCRLPVAFLCGTWRTTHTLLEAYHQHRLRQL